MGTIRQLYGSRIAAANSTAQTPNFCRSMVVRLAISRVDYGYICMLMLIGPELGMLEHSCGGHGSWRTPLGEVKS